VLDHIKVPTPFRLEVSRDGGPIVDKELKDIMKQRLGIVLGGYRLTPEVALREDCDAIIVDGRVMEKPFVEKPVSGEDHNVYIYFRGGGGRRLFRKVNHFPFSLLRISNSKHSRSGTSLASWILT
jgi:inositol hexakisphosphate/diphosphoinositol-pentakisphosphate kinase